MKEQTVLTAIIGAVETEAESGVASFDPIDFSERLRSLHRLVLAYVTKVLCDKDIFRTAGERHDMCEVAQTLQMSDRHQKLLSRWLNALCDESVLQRDNQTFVSMTPLVPQSLGPLLSDATQKWPEAPELVNCIKACGESLQA